MAKAAEIIANKVVFPTNSSYQSLSVLEKFLINKKKVNIINYGLTLPTFSKKVIDDFYKDIECQDNIKINKINAKEFENLYKEKFNNILLLDVRENEEFNKSSITI